MRQVPATLASLLLITASTTALSQEAPPADQETEASKLSAVIVTGTRSPKAIDKIPGAIVVVSKEDVAHTLAVTEDATAVLARTVPGYAEASQAMSNSGENLRGRIALRLFDGVPQGSPLREGTRNATFTDMGIVGRIEVINGPSASEGIGAAGGIINYISSAPNKPGHKVTINSRYTSQFKDDSGGWKIGATYEGKQDNYDLIAAVSRIERGMSYDGNGDRLGMNSSGTVMDTRTENVFLKGGVNFGVDKDQRVQLSLSNFKIAGKGNYHDAGIGDFYTGKTFTSLPGGVSGTLAEFNDFKQYTASYTHRNLAGGVLTLDAYRADQAMRYIAEDGDDRQTGPVDATHPRIFDQSEVRSFKRGLRSGYSRPDFLGITGLELRGGLDLTKDKVDQRLALTDRLWVPPMNYSSVAPWTQVSFDAGPLTVSGGFRRETGTLQVDSYVTTYYRKAVAVQGGSLDYKSDLPNLGVVLRLPQGMSVFVSTGKGFTLPNVGIPLRNINKPGQSVEGILDLQAIEVTNKELGFNWRGAMGSFGASYYDSYSELGASLGIDPVTTDFFMKRAPVSIKGIELSGEYKLSKELKATAIYSRIIGTTEFTAGGPLDKLLGAENVNPDKLGASVNWKFMPKAEITLGATKLFSRDLNEGKSGEEHTKGYTLYDLSANYDIGRLGKLSLGVENLTNEVYVMSWAQAVSFARLLTGRGRVISISHTISF